MGRAIVSLFSFASASLLVGLLALVVQPLELKWAIVGGSLAVLSVGFAFNGFMLAWRTDNTLRQILQRVEDIRSNQQNPSVIQSIATIIESIDHILNRGGGKE